MTALNDLEARAATMLRRAGLKHVDLAMVRAALVVVVALAALAAWRWWPRPAEPTVTFAAGPSGPMAEAGASRSHDTSTAADAPELTVHVVGAVRHPGVYRVSPGSRVIDAVEAAGGLLPDAVAETVNMARPVSDGEQIRVGDEDEAARASGPAAGGAAGATASGPVDLNSADVAALDALPGIGPSTAAKIVADREANGPFRTPEELSRVSGIGEKKLEQLKGLICAR